MKYGIMTAFASLMLILNPAKAIEIKSLYHDELWTLHSTIANVQVTKYKPSVTKNVIKLTVRHYPIAKIFVDEDEDEDLSVAQHYMLHRKDATIETVKNTDDDISDSVKLRLFLIREMALKKYKQTWA